MEEDSREGGIKDAEGRGKQRSEDVGVEVGAAWE